MITRLINCAEASFSSDQAVKAFTDFLKKEDSFFSSENEIREFLKKCHYNHNRSEILDIFINTLNSIRPILTHSQTGNRIKTTGENLELN